MTTRDLTPQQESFVTAYVMAGCSNATKAAIDAGYSKHTANPQAARLLAKASIQSAIQRKQAAVQVRIEYSHSDWLRDLQQDIYLARESGAHGAVMKGRELLGRHIGALTSDRRLNRDEMEAFTYLGAQMQRYISELEAGKQQSARVIESQGREVAE